MTASVRQQNTRARSRERYRDRDRVAEKWLDQYGNMSLEGDYGCNQRCLQETFNMVDIVMENTVNEYIHTYTPVKVRKEEYKTWYLYKNSEGGTFEFYYPTTFAARTTVLRQMGYPLPEELDTVRKLRNETAHGNQTVVMQNRSLDYEVIRKAMTTLADVLILTGMLDPGLREPSFEQLRVREGDTLQRGAYTVGRLTSEGGMGRVYEGIQKHMGRRVTLKELKPGTYSRNTIRYERDVLLRLHNDHIPHVYDMFFENGTYYIVMSYVNGVTLENYVARKYPLPMKTVVSTAESILDILAYLHSPDIRLIYGDLSPEKILIDGEGNPWLIDFGISGEARMKQKMQAATVGYSAPEMFEGGILDERTDVYSFGYLLRYMLTGCAPYERVGEETASLTHESEFSGLINSCIARNPEERFQNIDVLKAAFTQICEQRKQGTAKPKEKQHSTTRTQYMARTCFIAGTAIILSLALLWMKNTWDSRGEKEAYPSAAEHLDTEAVSADVTRSAAAGEYSSGAENEVAEETPDSGIIGNEAAIPSAIPEAVRISQSRIPSEGETDSDEEDAASDFTYNADTKMLTVTEPVDGWFTALVNWQETGNRNLALAVSNDPECFEFICYFCSPCIRNGEVSTIRLEYDNGEYMTYTFLAENGTLQSCSLDRHGQGYEILYTYSAGNLESIHSESGGVSLLDCLVQYDADGKPSGVVCNDSMYSLGYDENGYISYAELSNSRIYNFIYSGNEIGMYVNGSNYGNEEGDRHCVLNEDGTMASCRYFLPTGSGESQTVTEWENTYTYFSA